MLLVLSIHCNNQENIQIWVMRLIKESIHDSWLC